MPRTMAGSLYITLVECEFKKYAKGILNNSLANSIMKFFALDNNATYLMVFLYCFAITFNCGDKSLIEVAFCNSFVTSSMVISKLIS